jgi:ferredoxin
MVALESQGVALILGADDAAVAAGQRLADILDVTVLVAPGAEVTPPRRTAFPVLQGRARNAHGALGSFELTIDGYALPDPSSRARLGFGPARDGATSRADLILDLTGAAPLFPAADLRPGYLRADPRDPAAVERTLFDAAQLVGTFDRPRYIDFDAGLCAHSRSGIVGCTRCLDLCPTSAITPDGDSVRIDPGICAGCGQCAGACPTGAASYALPPVATVAARLRALLGAYAAAGGTGAVVLLHDGEHGEELIDASARFGRGLPARVLPLAVNEISQTGPETLAAAIAYGASAVRLLGRARPRHDIAGLHSTLALTATVLGALGYGDDAVGLIETDDPDALEAALAALPAPVPRAAPASFLPPSAKRNLLEVALRELHRVAPAPVDTVPLPAGAPFGAAVLDTEACTLCLACVSACPSAALADNPDRPMLRFTESLCVQCGLCANTCPENAITLVPQLDFPAWDEPRRVLKEEEPFHCVTCGKPFGTAATIARVRDRLAGHWMFSGPENAARTRILEMCDDCRITAVVNESFDPHDPDIRRPRTTDDYLRERASRKPE